MQMYNIVLVSVPFTVGGTPPLGIAVLKGAIESAGLKCRTIDLGMELYKHCDQDQDLFDRTQGYFVIPNLQNDSVISHTVLDFINHWAEKLAALNTEWIGFSVFSYYSHLATYMLCQRLRSLNPRLKIVVGGPGAFIRISDAMLSAFEITKLEAMSGFSEILRRRGLVNQIIKGDGEQALIDLLTDQEVGDHYYMEPYRERDYAFANFDDFDLSAYAWQNNGLPQLPIFSSKGCVRSCDFCDVAVVQNKFRFRFGENIFKEIIYLAERYNIRSFLFLDSLVNGSLKSMRDWVTRLAEYNQLNPDRRITWSSSGWICRPVGQMSQEFYSVLAESGLDVVSVGVESGSNHVLDAMDKKTNVEAVYFESEQFRQHGIKFIPLMMVGHWSEQWEDFLATCELMVRLAPLVKTGTMVAVDPGVPFVVLSDTPSDVNHRQNNMVVKRSQLWYCFDNPSLTARERYNRLLLLDQLLNEFNIPIQDRQLFAALYHRVRDILPELTEFYQEVSERTEKPTQHSRYYLDNFNEFVDVILSRIPRAETLDIELELRSSTTNGCGSIRVEYNNTVLFDDAVVEGIHTIKLQVPVQYTSNLSICFYGKNPNDTVVDEQGIIVKDKFIEILRYQIDGVDILADAEFFYQVLHYTVDDRPTNMQHGFWFNNSRMVLEFTGAFMQWYCRQSKKNSKFEVALVTNAQVPATQNKKFDFTGDRRNLLALLDQMQY